VRCDVSRLVKMLAKRCYGAGHPTFPLLATFITAVVYLVLWYLSSYPRPHGTQIVDASYLQLSPGNGKFLPPPYPMHKLAPSDLTTLIDLKDFTLQLNSFPCDGSSSMLLLVLVSTAPGHAEHRRTIRETWGSGFHRVLFLLGAVESRDAQAKLEEENRTYRDIVQGSFLDSYRNMTYKHVMALKWTAYYCPGARYLLKTDDDVFVNPPALLEFLSQDLSPRGGRRLILCENFTLKHVQRSLKSKWRVTPEEYPGNTYPPSCQGWIVLYSADVVFLLYGEAQRTKFFWIDDIHVTGTLAARAGLTHTSIREFLLSPRQVEQLVGSSKNDSGIGVIMFGSYNMSPTKIRLLWKVVEYRTSASTHAALQEQTTQMPSH